MKNDNNLPERAAVLVYQAVDALRRAGLAPVSPVNSFQPAQTRREFRRTAARLRQGKIEPIYKNLHSAEKLAGILERTVQRDEIIEQSGKEFGRLTMELGRVLAANDPEVRKALDAVVAEMKRAAETHGPASDAAQRYEILQFLASTGQDFHDRKRRKKGRKPLQIPLAPDPAYEARCEASAAVLLDAPPPDGETVIAIPPHGSDSGGKRTFIRIGTGERSWVGSFEAGHLSASTVVMMPDDKHLFVSAGGAGYIIEAESRTLVQRTGRYVVEVFLNPRRTLLMVNHQNKSLEVFGKDGRLWQTGIIACGGFRNFIVGADAFRGEAHHRCQGRWARFSVKLATGEVELES